jgi:FkbM family methyltransferase
LKLLPAVARVVANWPLFMYHYALGSVPARPYAFRNGARIQIGRGVDHAPIVEIFVRRDYGVLAGQSVVVDLGANIGVFAIYAALGASRARVYAYEASPSLYRLLRENVRLNDREHSIACYQCAVAGEAADRELYLEGADVFFPTLVPPAAGAAARVQVRCTTLDEILARQGLAQVDLLKIDIEGAEYEVLYGAGDALEGVREIRMEYHTLDATERNVGALTRFLTGRGYRITRQRADTTAYGNLWAAKP